MLMINLVRLASLFVKSPIHFTPVSYSVPGTPSNKDRLAKVAFILLDYKTVLLQCFTFNDSRRRIQDFFLTPPFQVGCLSSTLFMLIFEESEPALWLGTSGAGLFMSSVFPTSIALAEYYIDLTG